MSVTIEDSLNRQMAAKYIDTFPPSHRIARECRPPKSTVSS